MAARGARAAARDAGDRIPWQLDAWTPRRAKRSDADINAKTFSKRSESRSLVDGDLF
jgi:hypothetical protein